MTDDYKVQASIKVGPNRDHMINVRANTVNELIGHLDDLYGSRGFITNVIGSVADDSDPHFGDPTQKAVETLRQNGFPATQEFRPGQAQPNYSEPAQPTTYGPRPAAPICAHGEMKYYSGTNKNGEAYAAYFCSGPKGPNQCKAKFLD